MVLPLLQNEVVATGWVSESDFLTGLALVQAMPGPLFNFAAYLGARSAQYPVCAPWICADPPVPSTAVDLLHAHTTATHSASRRPS